MTANRLILRIVRAADNVINFIILTVIILLLTFAGYALWDSNQIYQGADKSQYAIYKPTVVNQGKSFRELQAINPEVFAWLTVYGTNIDYPVTQGKDNMKYVNTNAEGLYSLSGAIFLDYANSKHFTDFNSILYGHHMERKAMFGEIGSFADEDMFNARQYGNLYFDGKDHGIEFFAFIHTDAYDGAVFTPNVKGAERQEYLDNLFATAIHKRDVEITVQDRLILLSTCSSNSTNGRDILVGVISDEIYEDLQTEASDNTGLWSIDEEGGGVKAIPIRLWLLKLLLAGLVISRIHMTSRNRNKSGVR